MVGARLFNEQAGCPPRPIFGVVTAGESWQFLRLEGATVTLHRERLFIAGVGGVLGALKSILSAAVVNATT
jgi:hypothetical protein